MNLATPLLAVLLLARPGDHETSVAELPRSRVVSNPKDEIPHNGGWIALNLPLPRPCRSSSGHESFYQ